MSRVLSLPRGGPACFLGALAMVAVAAAAHAGTVTYAYDPVGRLISANYAADGLCINYIYDAAGNRSQVASTAPGPPAAAGDSVAAKENIPVTFDPRADDRSPSCYSLTITAVSAPGHGSAAVINSGTAVTYSPATNFAGADSFSYTISDGHGGTASATVAVTVSAVLTASIAPGPYVGAGPLSSNTFPTNHVTVTGGSGSFTYLWTETDDGGGAGRPAARPPPMLRG